MKQAHYILLIFTLTILPILVNSQNEKINFKNIGMLDEDDHSYFIDGGMGHLEAIIDSCNIKESTIKLTGQLVDKFSKEEVPYFRIYVAENIKSEYRLIITDTLENLIENKVNEDSSNEFSIKTDLKQSESIFFVTVGYGMLEVNIKYNP